MSGWVFALTGVSVWLAMRPTRLPPDPPPATHQVVRSQIEENAFPRRWLWSLLAGIGCWAFVSGIAGVVSGVLVTLATWLALGRLEPPARRRRRLRAAAELPHLVGLLASAVQAGLPPADAVAVVCDALPGPAADAMRELPPRIALGLDPVVVWGSLEADPALAPLGRTLARTSRTGEPVAGALDRLSEELGERARADREDLARRVGVRAAVPLGLCLLPAFLLLGIVPVVAGLAGTITR